jgi:hypothetical protein
MVPLSFTDISTLDREGLAALLGELKTLEGRVMGRLLLSASGQPTASPREDEHMLTVDEAAKVLRRGRQWIYRNAHSLPFVKRISRKSLLCSETGLKRWLAARKA